MSMSVSPPPGPSAFHDAVDAVEMARKEYLSAVEAERGARVQAVACLNSLNAQQRHLDKLYRALLEVAPTASDWGTKALQSNGVSRNLATD